MRTRSLARTGHLYGEMTPEYVARRAHRAVPPGYVLVESPARNGLVHLVKANTFKEVAVSVLRHGSVDTLCNAAAKETWALVPRNPDNGKLVSCPRCRWRLSDSLNAPDAGT